MWFGIDCILIDNEYASSQWSKCCGLTRCIRVSPQQILTKRILLSWATVKRKRFVWSLKLSMRDKLLRINKNLGDKVKRLKFQFKHLSLTKVNGSKGFGLFSSHCRNFSRRNSQPNSTEILQLNWNCTVHVVYANSNLWAGTILPSSQNFTSLRQVLLNIVIAMVGGEGKSVEEKERTED